MRVTQAVRDVLYNAHAELLADQALVKLKQPPVELPKVPTLDQIRALERAMKERPDQVDLPVKHHFADGLYARELFRPAGTLIVGKMHARQHFYVLVAGEITAWTEQGMKRINAPALLRTEPGTKRVTYAHVDSTCITFHATHETDLERLEAELIIPDVPEVEAPARALLELEKQQ